jgi:hypothetical protein
MLKLVGTRLRQNTRHPRSRIKIFWPCEMRSNSRENYQFMEDRARALFIMSPAVSGVRMHSGVLGWRNPSFMLAGAPPASSKRLQVDPAISQDKKHGRNSKTHVLLA